MSWTLLNAKRCLFYTSQSSCLAEAEAFTNAPIHFHCVWALLKAKRRLICVQVYGAFINASVSATQQLQVYGAFINASVSATQQLDVDGDYIKSIKVHKISTIICHSVQQQQVFGLEIRLTNLQKEKLTRCDNLETRLICLGEGTNRQGWKHLAAICEYYLTSFQLEFFLNNVSCD